MRKIKNLLYMESVIFNSLTIVAINKNNKNNNNTNDIKVKMRFSFLLFAVSIT